MRINSNGILVLFSFLFVLFLIPSAFASTLTAETITEEVDASITFTIEGASPDSLYSLQYNNTVSGLSNINSFSTDSNGDASFTSDFDSSTAYKGVNGYYKFHLKNDVTETIEDSFWFQYGLFIRYFDDFKDSSNLNDYHVGAGSNGIFDTHDENSGTLRLAHNVGAGQQADSAPLGNVSLIEDGLLIPTVWKFTHTHTPGGGSVDWVRYQIDNALVSPQYESAKTFNATVIFFDNTVYFYEDDTLVDTTSVSIDGSLEDTLEVHSNVGGDGGTTNINIDDLLVYSFENTTQIIKNDNLEYVYEAKDSTADWGTEDISDNGAGSPSYLYRTGNTPATTDTLSTFAGATDSIYIKPLFQLSPASTTDTILNYYKGNYELGGVGTGTDTILDVESSFAGLLEAVLVSSDPAEVRTISINISEYDDSNTFLERVTTFTDSKNPSRDIFVDIGDQLTLFYPDSIIYNEGYRYEATARLRAVGSQTNIDTFTVNLTAEDDGEDVAILSNPGVKVSPSGSVEIIYGARVHPSLSGMNDFAVQLLIDGNVVIEQDINKGSFDDDEQHLFERITTLSEGIHTVTVRLIEEDVFFDDIIDEKSSTITVYKEDPIRLIKPVGGAVVSDSNQVKLTLDYKIFEAGDLSVTVFDSNGDIANSQNIDPVASGNRRTVSFFTPELDDDDYTWFASFEGDTGQTFFLTETESFSVEFEQTTVTAISPGGDVILQDTTPDFQVQVDSNVPGELQIILDDSVFFSQTINPQDNSFLTLTPQVAVATGSHNWSAKHISTTTSIETTSNTLDFTIASEGSVGAEIILNTPENGDTFEGNSVPFSFDINSTNFTGLVKLVVDNIDKSQFAVPSVGFFSFNTTVDALASGSHSYYVDFDLNSSQTLRSESRQFDIENNITIDLVQPIDDQVIQAPPVSFLAEITTQASGTLYLIIDEAVVKSRQIDLQPFQTLEDQKESFVISNLDKGVHSWRMTFTEKNKGTAFDGVTSETRVFELLTAGEGVDDDEELGEGAIQDNGLIDRFIGGTASLLGVTETSAGFLIAVLLSLALAVGVSSIPSVKGAEHGAMVLIFVFLAGLVISSVALGLLSTSIIIVLVIIAGGLIFIASKKAGGG